MKRPEHLGMIQFAHFFGSYIMEFRSVREILCFAMNKERSSSLFYQDLADQMSDCATKAIFEALSRQVLKHVDALRLEMIKHGYTITCQLSI